MLIPTAKNREDAINQIDLLLFNSLYEKDSPEDLGEFVIMVNNFVAWLGIHDALDAGHKKRDEEDKRLTNEIEKALKSEDLKQKLLKLRDDVIAGRWDAERQIMYLAGIMIGLRVAESLKGDGSSIDQIIKELKAGKVSPLLA